MTEKEENQSEDLSVQISETVIKKLKYHQDFNFAISGGLVISFICAIIWAFITIRTQYQIGYMALGVGLAVGLGVRYFGAGIDKKFGIVGLILSLLGCLLGNLFSQIGFLAETYNQGYLETMSYLTFQDMFNIMTDSFQPMDVLFYGIAAYEGYKFAFRPIPDSVGEDDLTPPLAKLGLPLTVISLIIIAFTVYSISKGNSGFNTFNYESGKKMAEGELIKGIPNGDWKYWYENGKIRLTANFLNGLENGNWKWFGEDGMLIQDGNFYNGLQHGTWINYFNNIITDSGQFYTGRQHGRWIYFFGNGKVSTEGEYTRDLKSGLWKSYHENGKLKSTGEMKDNNNLGIWEFWDSTGKLIEKIEYTPDGKTKVIFASDKKGKQVVKNGNGVYTTLYDDGSTMQVGTLRNYEKVGIWTSFFPDGSKKEDGEFAGGVYKLINSWDTKGNIQVKNGDGHFTSYYDGTELVNETGEYKNGFKTGLWKNFAKEYNKVAQEVNYAESKMSGISKTYFESGSIYSEGSFLNDKQDGEWKWYFESGELQSSVTFRNGNKEGIQPFWNESGERIKEEYYKKGKFVNEKIIPAGI